MFFVGDSTDPCNHGNTDVKNDDDDNDNYTVMNNFLF